MRRALVLAAALTLLGAAGAERPANRLAGESSPYLQLHAHNPVDWYPWGPEAIERAALAHPAVLHARAEGKPNPLTGQHIELTCEATPDAELDRRALREHLKGRLPEALIPHRIKLGPVAIGHRFKRA